MKVQLKPGGCAKSIKKRSFHPITMSWQMVSELDKFNHSHHIFPKSFLPTLQPSKVMLSSSFSLLDLNLPFTYTDAHTTNKSTNLLRIFVVSILIRRIRFTLNAVATSYNCLITCNSASKKQTHIYPYSPYITWKC